MTNQKVVVEISTQVEMYVDAENCEELENIVQDKIENEFGMEFSVDQIYMIKEETK